MAAAGLAGGANALSEFTLRVGRPVGPMLAQTATGVADALERLGGEGVFEAKLDGARVQIHRRDGEVTVYTRSLDDEVTVVRTDKDLPPVAIIDRSPITTKLRIAFGVIGFRFHARLIEMKIVRPRDDQATVRASRCGDRRGGPAGRFGAGRVNGIPARHDLDHHRRRRRRLRAGLSGAGHLDAATGSLAGPDGSRRTRCGRRYRGDRGRSRSQ